MIDGIANELYHALSPEVVGNWEAALAENPEAAWYENRLNADSADFSEARDIGSLTLNPYDAIGVDIDPQVLDWAREQFRKLGPEVHRSMVQIDFSTIERHCPQRMPIARLMKQALKEFS